ncbi:MAG: ATP-binding protein [Nocardioidaceae bacterium]|nr:ATP-binding protein [Nocardioidaceae bacterium]
MSFQDLRAIALFDGLSDSQLLELMTVGEELDFNPGEELFGEARPADYWWVLLGGTISLVRRAGHEETVLSVMDSPGQWAGGFQAWDAHGVYLATGRGASSGRVLRVPAEMLRDRADAWFPFGVHLIRGLVHTVRNIESTARQREALVALGRLAAGLAHEINNPASAATRAVDALEDTSAALLSSLGRLAAGPISAAQFVALDALRREARPQSASMRPLAVADREDALSDWLVGHGIERDWLIAPPLAAAGLDIDWCERAAVLLDGGPLEAGLEWVASSLSMATLLSEVKESTRRISELVAAVRSYSQLDRASMQQTDLTEGLESTLVMLAHKLKGGVTVARDYGNDVPRIEAIAGELNQVWTNLIDNAIDAMGGTGTLRVSTRVDENGVVVEIGDTGPGMPKEVQAHAFEPFYTTKDVGKGTGLGLDISRRIIVERHGGEIVIESRPGETVIRVRLPLLPARPP